MNKYPPKAVCFRDLLSHVSLINFSQTNKTNSHCTKLRYFSPKSEEIKPPNNFVIKNHSL